MAIVFFDTHKVFTELKRAGFSEAQAEVLLDLQKAMVNHIVEQVRQQYYELDTIAAERDLKDDEPKTHQDTKDKDIAEIKSKLIRWLVCAGLLQITITIGMILLIPSSL
ncbi:DUF1640 domain-containing protein [Methylovulum psychrotolerans]|uniref:DUF1640 domain-containing protein n=1 Tax=Methylovulum psychrotolerans TaxID=1704499 RepID=UPI001BFFA0BF|nr:DUF1640 domain-containing protein [Methylovulum psychrotolerans]MBT9097767.1 DUF1640 domain-containing protein [Methylovulum psychrotolerans]